MENEKKLIRAVVIAKCESCKFVRNGVEITGDRFTNDKGYMVILHLEKHREHIMKLIFGSYIARYKILNNIFTAIDPVVVKN
jgi:hypothetical protein